MTVDLASKGNFRPPAKPRYTPLNPMRAQTAKSMSKLADRVKADHPDLSTHQHIRDAARMLRSGSEEAAQRHLRAAMFSLSPQSLMRNGKHTDDIHMAARDAMHGVHRHLLLVKDIEDVATRNREAIQRDSYGDDGTAPPRPDPNGGYGPGALAQKPTARQPGGDKALNAPDRTSSGGSDPAVTDPSVAITVNNHPKPRVVAASWGDIAGVIELATRPKVVDLVGPRGYIHGWIYVDDVPGLPSVAEHNAKLRAKGVTPPTKAHPALTRKPPAVKAKVPTPAAKAAPEVRIAARAPVAATAPRTAAPQPIVKAPGGAVLTAPAQAPTPKAPPAGGKVGKNITAEAGAFADPAIQQKALAEIQNALDAQAKIVPGIARRLKISYGSPEKMGRSMGLTGGTRLTFSPKISDAGTDGIASKDAARYRATGWWSKADPGRSMTETTIAHETGHVVTGAIPPEVRYGPELWSGLAKAMGLPPPTKGTSWGKSAKYKDFADADPWMKANKAAIQSAVSEYGASNSMELMGEMWSEYTMSSAPRPAAKFFGDYALAHMRAGS